MKKTLRLMAVAAVFAMTVAGCSGPSSSSGEADSSETKTLELWMPPLASDNQDKAMWDRIVEPFEKENGVDVNVTVIPWDSYETKYLTGVTSDQGPDVGYMYSEMIGDYIAKDQLVDMTGLVTPEQKSNLLFLDKGVFNSKQYSLPLVVGGARVILYNKDLLEQAGVQEPTTWEEFVAAGIKLKEAGIKPLAAAWGDPSRGTMNTTFFPFVWQTGGDLFAADGKTTLFDSPEVIKAAQYVMELKEKGVLSEDATGATPDSVHKEFLEGKVAFLQDSDQFVSQAKDAGVNYGVITSLKEKQQGTFIAADSLVMLKKCSNQDLCYKLIDFLTKGPQMTEFHKLANFPPIGKDEVSTYPEDLAKVYLEQPEILHPLPIVPGGTGTYQVLYTHLQQMVNGQKTPEQALGDAAKEANAMLK